MHVLRRLRDAVQPLRQAAVIQGEVHGPARAAARQGYGALRFHQRVYDAASIALALHGEIGENRALALIHI